MSNQKAVIVGFVADETTARLLQKGAARAGFTLYLIADKTAVGPSHMAAQQESPGELLTGVTGRLFELITQWQPALLVFDLTNTAVPWNKWIPSLKSSPATRRLPILGFSPIEEDRREAKRLGANYIYTATKFNQETANIIQKHARLPDFDALQATCRQRLPELAIEGLTLFNQGEYYKCHDSLEEAWRQDQSVGRDLYRGILQIGIAYFQIKRGNYRGAQKMLLRVRQWLDPLPDTCRGVDIADLRRNASAVQKELTALGPNRIAEFDRRLFKPVRFTV